MVEARNLHYGSKQTINYNFYLPEGSKYLIIFCFWGTKIAAFI